MRDDDANQRKKDRNTQWDMDIICREYISNYDQVVVEWRARLYIEWRGNLWLLIEFMEIKAHLKSVNPRFYINKHLKILTICVIDRREGEQSLSSC